MSARPATRGPSAGRLAWLGRIVLLAQVAILTLIAVRTFLSPAGAAAELGLTLGGATGAIALRVGFGAFPLAFAAILAACAFSERWRRHGLVMAATLMGVAAAARVTGLALDGPSPRSARLLAPELVLFVAASALAISDRRRASSGEAPGIEAGPPAAAAPAARRGHRAGWIGTALVITTAALMGVSSVPKLAQLPSVVAEMAAVGFGRTIWLVATLELLSAALLLLPATRRVGVYFASAFWGGAIATHVQHGQLAHAMVPALLLALLWTGTWLARIARAEREAPMPGERALRVPRRAAFEPVGALHE